MQLLTLLNNNTMFDKYYNILIEGKCLSEERTRLICEKAKDILIEESNVLHISTPVTICGDIHGQFYDLISLMKEAGGAPPKNKFLFLGDYVDRGPNSIETMQILLLLKILYPKSIFLLRGNHETRQISFIYGFNEEIQRKFGNNFPFKLFVEVFDLLPISAVIDDRIFCVHGGLSPQITKIDQIRLINRKCEIPHEGPFCDLVWSDPDDIETWNVSSRGAGWTFGAKVTSEFLRVNGLEFVIRGHQLVNDGYKFWFKEKNLITVWSCPNYCYRCGNKGAFCKVKNKGEKEFVVFDSVNKGEEGVKLNTIVPYFL